MKTISLVLAALGFANGVLAKDEPKSLSAFDEMPDKVVFGDDKMACCGSLTELGLEKNDHGGYQIGLRRVYTDWRRQECVDVTEVISSDLSCQFSQEIVICKQDLRPENGVLTKMIFSMNEKGLYDVEKISVPSDDDKAAEVKFVKIADGLTLLEAH